MYINCSDGIKDITQSWCAGSKISLASSKLCSSLIFFFLDFYIHLYKVIFIFPQWIIPEFIKDGNNEYLTMFLTLYRNSKGSATTNSNPNRAEMYNYCNHTFNV